MATEVKSMMALLGGITATVNTGSCTTCNEWWPASTQWCGQTGQLGTAATAEWQFFQGTNVTTNQWQFFQAPIINQTIYGQFGGGAWVMGPITNAPNAPNIWVPAFTPEELKAIEVAEEKRRVEREAAKARATTLLRSTLSKEQLEQFEHDGHFDVKIDKHTYRITPGRKVLPLYDPGAALCVVPKTYDMPVEDVALAQKLMLETNEKEFLKLAIRWAA